MLWELCSTMMTFTAWKWSSTSKMLSTQVVTVLLPYGKESVNHRAFASSGCPHSFFHLANFVILVFLGISVVNSWLDYVTLCLLAVCISSFVSDGTPASNLMVVHNRLNLTNLTQKHEVPRRLAREHKMETRGRPAPRGSKCLRTTEETPQPQRERWRMKRTWDRTSSNRSNATAKCEMFRWKHLILVISYCSCSQAPKMGSLCPSKGNMTRRKVLNPTFFIQILLSHWQIVGLGWVNVPELQFS